MAGIGGPINKQVVMATLAQMEGVKNKDSALGIKEFDGKTFITTDSAKETFKGMSVARGESEQKTLYEQLDLIDFVDSACQCANLSDRCISSHLTANEGIEVLTKVVDQYQEMDRQSSVTLNVKFIISHPGRDNELKSCVEKETDPAFLSQLLDSVGNEAVFDESLSIIQDRIDILTASPTAPPKTASKPTRFANAGSENPPLPPRAGGKSPPPPIPPKQRSASSAETTLQLPTRQKATKSADVAPPIPARKRPAPSVETTLQLPTRQTATKSADVAPPIPPKQKSASSAETTLQLPTRQTATKSAGVAPPIALRKRAAPSAETGPAIAPRKRAAPSADTALQPPTKKKAPKSAETGPAIAPRKRAAPSADTALQPPTKQRAANSGRPPLPIPPLQKAVIDSGAEVKFDDTPAMTDSQLSTQIFSELGAITKKITRHQEMLPPQAQFRYATDPTINKIPRETAVILPTAPPEEGKEAKGAQRLHGNYVRLHPNEPITIATQAPRESAMGDFWLASFTHDTKAIVDLTQTEDMINRKVQVYYPLGEETLSLESGGKTLEISLLSETPHPDNPDIKTSTYSVVDDKGIAKEVCRVHFSGWVDRKGVDPDVLNQVIETVDDISGTDCDGGVTVHCSAGVGRTGTFITARTAKHQLSEEKMNSSQIKDEILNLTTQGRAQRNQVFVQKAEQMQTLISFFRNIGGSG